jgi:NADH:ubiquinone oxidoreductase subunit H
LVELHRAPFDFSEGESELVRGFNTELRSLLFVLIFLSEYGFLIFYVLFIIRLNFGGGFFFGFIIFFLIIEIRSVFPRFRYDKNIRFCWLVILPLIIFIFLVFFLIFPYNFIMNFIFVK